MTGGSAVAGEHVEKLGLVLQVLKESMRLFPPVPMMSRQAVADARIGAHDITAGTSILMPIYAIHRHARRWEDPDVFDPTRFAPEGVGPLTLSGGGRIVASRFAGRPLWRTP